MLVSCQTASPRTQSSYATLLFPGTISPLDWSVEIPVAASPALVPRPPALSHSFVRIRIWRQINELGHFLKHLLLRSQKFQVVYPQGNSPDRSYVKDLVIFHERLTQFKLTTKRLFPTWIIGARQQKHRRRIAESTTTSAVVRFPP